MPKSKINPEVRKRFLEILDKLRDEGEPDCSLAEKLGVTPPCISQYRHGKRIPDTTIILRLSEHTKNPLKYFFSDN
jgi:transcriptional regulator with XRE-family HTH domain